MKKPNVLVILGPTASGKSDLAVKLAKQFDGEIISADSRQVYKGLDVGSGKITQEEMQGVPHYLLDVADPRERFSASDFVREASRFLATICQSGKLPIVVGGTGFYIDALTGDVTLPEVPPNPILREELERKSAEELFEMILNQDPQRALTIDKHNKVRLIRALEIIEALGSVPTWTPGTNTHKSNESTNYNFIYIGLLPNDLEDRIYTRIIKRLPKMIEEAQSLYAQGLTYERMHELGLEYRYLAMLLQGQLTQDEMIEKLNIEIRKYAKRQMTWFRRNESIRWFKPGEHGEITQHLNSLL
jgi:tRNA dimethylallyltransferase